MIRRRLAGVLLAVARFFDLIDPARQPADRFDIFPNDCTDPGCNCGNQCYDQDDPCLEPNLHALQGCERCQNVVAACCLFAFDESLAKLWQAEGQQP